MRRVNSIVIFGGTGFLGTHLAMHLCKENLADEIFLVDLTSPRTAPYASLLNEELSAGRIKFIEHDIRTPVPAGLIPVESPEIIMNIAALHREGEHTPAEFFATNVIGAETVCAYAAAVGCNRIVFTSTISQYGLREEFIDEHSLSIPETPYGISKLVAEKVHLAWLAGSGNRKLIVIRPGVLFGPGEAANVTRLIHSIVKGYFVYVGNEGTRKAGGYIKELCHVIDFAVDHQESSGECYALMNFSMTPTPTLQEYVRAIQSVVNSRRRPLRIPRRLLLIAAYLVDRVARIFGIKQPITPLRVRKASRNTYIEATRLRELGYQWKFTLEEALRDWMRDAPEDFRP